ncbi:MAG: hypothetical protein CMN73_04410 [Sphingomonas sp.]|nr:hypothetical protein [Sphingomonas sp.]|tara:strand:- start:351 stop:671 length:321 start_codon:yes stop_codon:yes gene_type:complete
MAIIKEISDRGIQFNYHRIGAVQSNMRGALQVQVLSWINAEAAASGAMGSSLMDDQPINPAFLTPHRIDPDREDSAVEVPPLATLYDYLMASSAPLAGGVSDEVEA